MSAGAHLWQRLRRWWGIQCLQAEHTQLDQAIKDLEAGVRMDSDTLAALRAERADVSMRLRYALTVDGLHSTQPPRSGRITPRQGQRL